MLTNAAIDHAAELRFQQAQAMLDLFEADRQRAAVTLEELREWARSKPGPSTIQGEPVQEKERRFSVARAQQIARLRKTLAVPKFQAVTGFDMVAGFVQAGG